MAEKLTSGPRIGYDVSKVGAGLTRGPNLQKKAVAAVWSSTFPAPGATLDLDFANDRGFVRGVGQGRSMDAVTFTRASVGKFVDNAGLVQDAAINVPRFDWASTASTGAGTIADPRVIPLLPASTCNGLLIEESRANRILWCRDATQSNWTKTNVTAAKNQTGIDGVANAASSLTATADGGTCIQTITLASGSRTASVYLKRITGTGNVQVSLDGSTWSTVDLSSTEWRRIVLSGTVTNPVVGIRIATNGDAVAMDYAQVEDGAFATTPILTTTASATRSADVATMTGQNFAWFNPLQGTLRCDTLSPIAGISGQSRYFAGFWQSTTLGLAMATYNWDSSVSTVCFSTNTRFSPRVSGYSDTAMNSNAGYYGQYSNGIANKNLVASNATNYATGQPMNYTTFRIGSDANSNAISFLNGCISRLVYFPKALSNATLNNAAGGAT